MSTFIDVLEGNPPGDRDLWVYLHFYNIGVLLYFFLRDWLLAVFIGVTVFEFLETSAISLYRYCNPGNADNELLQPETAFGSSVIDFLSVSLGAAVTALGVQVLEIAPVRESVDARLVLELAALMLVQFAAGLERYYWCLPPWHAGLLLVILLALEDFALDSTAALMALWAIAWLGIGVPLPSPFRNAFYNMLLISSVLSLALLVIYFAK